MRAAAAQRGALLCRAMLLAAATCWPILQSYMADPMPVWHSAPRPRPPSSLPPPQPTSLMDEVHVCMLRALCVDETPKERAEHGLDPSLLDAMTWPPYVWEFLRLTEDELAEQEWAHRATPKQEAPDAAGGKKGGGRKGSGGAAARKAKEAAAAAAAAASSAGGAAPRPKSFQPLSQEAQEVMDEVVGTRELAPAGTAPAQNAASFAAAAPPPAPPAPEYYSLPLELKSAILARLCDHLLDCLTVRGVGWQGAGWRTEGALVLVHAVC